MLGFKVEQVQIDLICLIKDLYSYLSQVWSFLLKFLNDNRYSQVKGVANVYSLVRWEMLHKLLSRSGQLPPLRLEIILKSSSVAWNSFLVDSGAQLTIAGLKSMWRTVVRIIDYASWHLLQVLWCLRVCAVYSCCSSGYPQWIRKFCNQCENFVKKKVWIFKWPDWKFPISEGEYVWLSV